MEPILPKQIGTEEGKLLFQKSEEVKDIEEAIKIVKLLKKTLDFYGGVGLAAPQIGILKRVFIVDIRPSKKRPNLDRIGFRAYINPQIKEFSQEINKDVEGCLSVFYATLYGAVERFSRLKIECINTEGKRIIEEITDPFHARVVQHENDHLDGIIFLQRMRKEDFATLYWNEDFDIRKKNS